MPALETMDRQEDAVYWPSTGISAANGRYVVDESLREEVEVRWKFGRREAPQGDGDSVTSDAQVITDFNPPLGSIFWEGVEADLADNDPAYRPTSGLYSVIAANKARDIKGRTDHTRYEVFLMRATDTLPVSE